MPHPGSPCRQLSTDFQGSLRCAEYGQWVDTLPDRASLRDVARVCLDAAKVLIASGAETARVEETVTRIGAACGVEVESIATPTGITVSVGGDRPVTRLARVRVRTIDMSKVAAVNALSRSLEAGEISLRAAGNELCRLLQSPGPSLGSRPRRRMYLAQSLATSGFALLVGGGPKELVPALLLGLLARLVDERVAPLPPFLAVFLNALAVSICAGLSRHVLPGINVDVLIVAGVIPLLPGLALTNAARDLMAGELIAGVARGADSILTAAALAGGVCLGVSLMALHP